MTTVNVRLLVEQHALPAAAELEEEAAKLEDRARDMRNEAALNRQLYRVATEHSEPQRSLRVVVSQ